MIDCITHAFERVIGPIDWKGLKQKNTHVALVEEGFSPNEAKDLAWIFDHRNLGRNYGFLTGVFVTYCCDRWVKKYTYNLPYLRLHRSSLWIVRGMLVFATLQAFDYWTTARRKGGDMGLAHDLLWVNTRYTESKERFIRNFEVMNRKLTDLEREILSARQVQQISPIKERRWLYNPNIHGPDEQAFWNNVKRNFIDRVSPWERYDVQQQIIADNKQKIEDGEQIKLKPYCLSDDVDSTGVKFGFRRNPFVNRWSPLQ